MRLRNGYGVGMIPWKLKSTAFRLADILGPEFLYFSQKHFTGRSTALPHKPTPVWLYHEKNLVDRNARNVIEFGAGKNLIQNLYLSALGIEQVVVDINPMLDFDLANAAIDRLASFGHAASKHVNSTNDLKTLYGISYIAPMDMRQTSLAASSFDACISTNTLEHIPVASIRDIWREVRRLLRPNGVVSAKIDYSDHYAHTDKSLSLLHFLKYSEAEWSRHNHNYHFQNRLRHKHHVELLRDAGFVIIRDEASSPRDATGLDLFHENLTGDESDFCSSGTILAEAKE